MEKTLTESFLRSAFIRRYGFDKRNFPLLRGDNSKKYDLISATQKKKP